MTAPDVRDARDAGFRTALLVVVVGLVVAWFAFPREARSDPAYGDLPPGTPLRVVAHTIGLDAHVVPVAVSPEGVLDPPDDYRLVGWWRGSARPRGPDRTGAPPPGPAPGGSARAPGSPRSACDPCR